MMLPLDGLGLDLEITWIGFRTGWPGNLSWKFSLSDVLTYQDLRSYFVWGAGMAEYQLPARSAV